MVRLGLSLTRPRSRKWFLLANGLSRQERASVDQAAQGQRFVSFCYDKVYSCWIESVKEIMQSYTEKTDVAFIEEKESMIVWNYKDSDPEFGNWQAKELTSHLEHVFCNLPIEIVQGKRCLEVVPNQLKKVLLHSI